jgi:hypothetical protein
MEAPGKLPAKKFVRDGKYTIDRAKYVVTGDREVTTVLTVWRYPDVILTCPYMSVYNLISPHISLYVLICMHFYMSLDVLVCPCMSLYACILICPSCIPLQAVCVVS